MRQIRHFELQFLIVFSIVFGVALVEVFRVLATTQTVVYKAIQ